MSSTIGLDAGAKGKYTLLSEVKEGAFSNAQLVRLYFLYAIYLDEWSMEQAIRCFTLNYV
jgi:hypothetical protein